MFNSQTIANLATAGYLATPESATQTAMMELLNPAKIWWSAAPGTIHHGDGGHTWARIRVCVEWRTGTYAEASIKACSIGVEVENPGCASAVEYLLADVFRQHLTEDAEHHLECAAIDANDAWKDGLYDQTGGPCVCGQLLPEVRHPQDDCSDCNRGWAELDARAEARMHREAIASAARAEASRLVKVADETAYQRCGALLKDWDDVAPHQVVEEVKVALGAAGYDVTIAPLNRDDDLPPVSALWASPRKAEVTPSLRELAAEAGVDIYLSTPLLRVA